MAIIDTKLMGAGTDVGRGNAGVMIIDHGDDDDDVMMMMRWHKV